MFLRKCPLLASIKVARSRTVPVIHIDAITMTFRVVCYNILVPIYAERPEFYRSCDEKYLQREHRWNLIRSELEREILQHENTIVCLQELSLPFLPRLDLFFRQLNYTFYHHLYGKKSNDFMGVGMAIPASMQLNNMHYIRLTDLLQSMNKPIEQSTDLLSWGWNSLQTFIEKFLRTPIEDPWQLAMQRENTLICLELTINGKDVCVGTYHMPCAFRQPDLMAIHSSFVKDLMFQLANGKDFVLAGDFNLKPSDPNYRQLVEKDLPFQVPPSKTYRIQYRANREQILRSAYREKTGAEPVYTNYSDTPGGPSFCATLDYIFFHGQLTVENVLELPDHPQGLSYPDETHPSDHLMIAATFR